MCGKVMFSYCLCLCLPVWAITFECLDIEIPFLVWWDILTISRSSLSQGHLVKVKHFGTVGFSDFFCCNQLMVFIGSSHCQGQLKVKVISESNCKCLDFYHEVGSGSLPECILVSLRHSMNGDFCGHSRFVLWHENLTTFVS